MSILTYVEMPVRASSWKNKIFTQRPNNRWSNRSQQEENGQHVQWTFFTNIRVQRANKIHHHAISDNQFPLNSHVPKFHFSKVKPSFVLKELQSLPVNKAVGLDRISGRLLKLSATVIDNSIAFMLNLSLKAGKFSTEWKTAKVVPIHKKDPLLTQTTTDQSLKLPILSTIMERFVHTR